MDTTIKHNNIEFKVEYRVEGRHIPATHYQPEEHPEIELISVMVKILK